MLQRLFKFFGYSKLGDEQAGQLPLRVFQVLSGKKDVEMLLKNNALYISKARKELPFNDAEFEKLIIPLIEFIAKFYLNLPASYDHHHREKGGAFEHALQTGISAISMLSKHGTIYRLIDPEYRHEHKFALPFAVFIMALTHDTGKPMTDFIVRACDRELNIDYDIPKWVASKVTLFSWVKEYNVKYYKAFYDSNRVHKKHEYYSGIVLPQITEIIENYNYDELVKKYINEVLLKDKSQTNTLITNILKAADQHSTRYYMESYGRAPQDNCNSSMFFEGLESLYFGSDNHQQGYFSKPYFWSDSGLHVHYPNGLNAIHEAIIGLGKHLSNSSESPADSLINILHNSNQLLLVGKSSPKHCAIHTIYVEDVFVNADGEETKRWSSTSVITIKQPHLLKLLQSGPVYKSSYEEPSNSDVIPLTARGLNDDPLGYYESLKNDNEAVVNQEATEPELSSETQSEMDQEIEYSQQNNEVTTDEFPTEDISSKDGYEESGLDLIDNISDHGSDQIISGQNIEDVKHKIMKKSALDTIEGISVKSKSTKSTKSTKKTNKNVADPNAIKKAALEMLGLPKNEGLITNANIPMDDVSNVEVETVMQNPKQVENIEIAEAHGVNDNQIDNTTDTAIKHPESSSKPSRKRRNKKISDFIREYKFESQVECDFVINILLRISYLYSQEMIDTNNSDILTMQGNNILLDKKFLTSLHFNLPVKRIIVENYLYKGDCPVIETLRTGYLVDESLSNLILGK